MTDPPSDGSASRARRNFPASGAKSDDTSARAVLDRPVVLLRLEGLALGAAAVWAFALSGASGWLFAALVLAPDLAMLGYLAGPRAGAACYNAVHTYAAPVALAAVASAAGWSWGLPVAFVWGAHVGLDRALGYGLKLPDGFHSTHLGRIGRADA